MQGAVSAAGLFLLVSSVAFGQNGESKLEFEVASIKPAAPPGGGGGRGFVRMGMQGGPGSSDPGQVRYSGLPLKFLLANAYDVRPYQINGPGWLDMERFDIVAKVPPGTTKEQVRVMLQNLLADRFGMKLHHESKESPVYELVVDKNGPKLKQSAVQEEASAPKADEPALPPGPPKRDKDGFPVLDRPGLIMMMTMGPTGPRSRMVGKGQTLAQFAQALGNQVNRPVVDKTALTGKYDFTLEFTFEPGSGPAGLPSLPLGPPQGGGGGGAVAGGPGGPGPVSTPLDNQSGDAGPTIFTAVQEQLGLKLEAKKAPLDLLVIDHIERTPTEN
jgi:uncharacterized protein (TIGR03435 family)